MHIFVKIACCICGQNACKMCLLGKHTQMSIFRCTWKCIWFFHLLKKFRNCDGNGVAGPNTELISAWGTCNYNLIYVAWTGRINAYSSSLVLAGTDGSWSPKYLKGTMLGKDDVQHLPLGQGVGLDGLRLGTISVALDGVPGWVFLRESKWKDTI